MHERLSRAEQEAVRTAAPGERPAELVVRDRAQLVQHAFDAEYGGLRSAAPRLLSGSGFFDGHDAGSRANLDPSALTRRRKALR